MGTFHKLASSGRSSSESWYSSSNSLTDLRVGCHDPRRPPFRAERGERASVLLLGDGDSIDAGLLGDGERDRRRPEDRIGSEGTEGLVKSLRPLLRDALRDSRFFWAIAPLT